MHTPASPAIISMQTTLAFLDRIQTTVDLVARVVTKYPLSTLPASLQGFLDVQRVLLASDCNKIEGYLVVHTAVSWHRTREIHIPIAWLDMHQSQLTKAVRQVYWDSRHDQEDLELARLAQSAAAHRQAALRRQEQAARELKSAAEQEAAYAKALARRDARRAARSATQDSTVPTPV